MARIAIGDDEKKKLYLLGGLFVAIAVVVVVLYVPRGGNKTVPTPPVTSGTPSATGQPVGAPGAPGLGGPAGDSEAPPSASAASGGINAASLVSVQNFRTDPFARFKRPPLPVIPPPPAPPAPPEPVVILPPEQVQIMPPNSGSDYSSGGLGLPPMDINSGRIIASPGRALTGLPPVSLPTRPVVPSTPAPPAGQGGAGSIGISESPNKRVSGVIIGDSVRALLEISDGGTTTTRIVQPGDEIDGIRILRIERVTLGGRPVTRVIIRENGEERSVLLKSAPRESATGGIGGAGIGGAGAGPGGIAGRGARP